MCGILLLSSAPRLAPWLTEPAAADSRGLSIPTPCPNITRHVAVRMIFLKPMTTRVTHLIKTFQWLPITLKIQAEILKTCLQVQTWPCCCHLSECPLGSPHLHPATPGRLASRLVCRHIRHITSLPWVICTCSSLCQCQMNFTSLLIYENQGYD